MTRDEFSKILQDRDAGLAAFVAFVGGKKTPKTLRGVDPEWFGSMRALIFNLEHDAEVVAEAERMVVEDDELLNGIDGDYALISTADPALIVWGTPDFVTKAFAEMQGFTAATGESEEAAAMLGRMFDALREGMYAPFRAVVKSEALRLFRQRADATERANF